MKRTIKLIIYGFLTITVMTAIFLLSAQDADSSAFVSDGLLNTFIGRIIEKLLPITGLDINHAIRKYAHVAEYFCLGVSSALFFRELLRGKTVYLLWSVLLGFLYACSDEWHQTFVPGRSGSFSDVCIDLAGIAIGTGLLALICFLSRSRKRGI